MNGLPRYRHYNGINATDQTVLEFTHFTAYGRDRFDAIEGLDLAPIQAPEAVSGMAHPPSPACRGGSGGPIVNDQCQIIATMSSGLRVCDYNGDEISDRSPLQGYDFMRALPNSYEEKGSPVWRFFANSIADPAILKALGRAGESVRIDENPAPINALMAGFGLHVAVMAKGTVRPANRRNGLDLEKDTPAPSPGSFNKWDDVIEATSHLTETLYKIRDYILKNDLISSDMRDNIIKYSDTLNKNLNISPTASMSHATTVARIMTVAANQFVHDESLKTDLVDAAFHAPWVVFLKQSSPAPDRLSSDLLCSTKTSWALRLG